MKKNVFLILLLISFFTTAQTQRFVYEFQFKLDSTSVDYEKTNMILDINPDDVKFYEHDLLSMDSINKANNNSRYQFWGYQNAISRKRNTFKNKNYEMIDELFVFETEDFITWTLSEETTKMDKYDLQKATTNFGGRSWTAWFCKDIPFNEGPYKFRGLPGLIFQIQDSKNQFIYSMIQSKSIENTFDTAGILENYGGNKTLEVSIKLIEKKKLENYNDPFRDFRLEFNDNPDTKYFVNGVKITSKDQLKSLEKGDQERTRKENNPIEIDKALHYPVK